MLDVAVHPDYAHTGWIYLSYSEPGGTEAGASSTRVIRGPHSRRPARRPGGGSSEPRQSSIGTATSTSVRVFVSIARATFIFRSATAATATTRKALASPFGKLHRIHDDGRIPADNPFVDRAGAVKSIYSYGHRNQQGIAQHPVTGESDANTGRAAATSLT